MGPIQLARGTAPTPEATAERPSVDIATSGDFGAEIASLAVQDGDAEVTTEQEARDLGEQAQARADAAQVQAMHDEATSMRAEGVFDAVTAVGTGCLKAYCPGASFVAEAAGKVGDGLWHAAQHDDEAAAAAQKASSDQAKSAAQDDAEAASDAKAYVKAGLDFYREYVSTEAQTQSAALHRA